MLYQRLSSYLTKDEILGIKLVNQDFNFLNAIITEYTNDKEFIPFVQKLETDSTVIYIDAYSKHTVIVFFKINTYSNYLFQINTYSNYLF